MKRLLITVVGLLAVTASAQNKRHHGGGFYHGGRWHSTHHGRTVLAPGSAAATTERTVNIHAQSTTNTGGCRLAEFLNRFFGRLFGLPVQPSAQRNPGRILVHV